MDFRLNDWNVAHIAQHGVSVQEAEAVVRLARNPYPRKRPNEKWYVAGRGNGGRIIQVVFIEDEDGSLYVIHARPLTEMEKRRWRRENNE